MKRASELAHAMRRVQNSKMVQDEVTETTISATTSVDLAAFEARRPTEYAPRSRSASSDRSDTTNSWRSDNSRGATRGAPRGRGFRGNGRGRGNYQRYSGNDHEGLQGEQEYPTANSTYHSGRGRARGRGRGRGRGSTMESARGRGRGTSYARRDSGRQDTEETPSERWENPRGRGGRGRSHVLGATRGPRDDGSPPFRGGPSRGRGRGRGRGDERGAVVKSGWRAELRSLQNTHQ
jgi:hypothetical protein